MGVSAPTVRRLFANEPGVLWITRGLSGLSGHNLLIDGLTVNFVHTSG
jgi:hypothetical protein